MPIVHFRDSSAKNGDDTEKYDARMQLQIAPNTNLSSSRELVVIHHIPKPPPSSSLTIPHRERAGLSVLGFEVMYKLMEKLRRWPDDSRYPTFHHISRTLIGARLRGLRADTRKVTQDFSLSYVPVKASAALHLPARVAHAILLMNEHRKRPVRDGRLCLMCGSMAVFDNREDLDPFPEELRPVDSELGCNYQSGAGHWVVMGLSLIPGFGDGSSSKLCHRHIFQVQQMFHHLMYDDSVEERPRTPLDASEARERYIGHLI